MSTRYSRYSKWVWTIGLMGISTAVFADEPKTRPPQEPAGFVVGGVIGAFAAGPIGAVVGAGLGTWLGNRVHRASDAKKAEVLRKLVFAEKPVNTGDGRWFTVRIMPSRTLDDRIDGVVITFADITVAKNLEAQLRAFMDYYNTTMAHPFAWTYTGKPVQKKRRASFVAPHRRLKLGKSRRLAKTATLCKAV